MKKQTWWITKSMAGTLAAATTLLLEGALVPSFTQGQAATFITWFRANVLESGWVAGLGLVALFSGIVGLFIGEQKGIKIFTGILGAVAGAFLGGDAIINFITSKFLF